MNSGTFIILFMMLIAAFFMLMIGIVQIQSKKPVGFYAGETAPDETELTDTQAWNRKHGILWVLYGITIVITSLIGVSMIDSVWCIFPLIGGVAQIDGHILLLCQLNNIPGTIISTGGCIEHLIRAVLNKQKRLSASRQHYGRDHAQHGTFDEMLVDDLRFIHTLDDVPCKFVADPLVAVGVLKIYLCIVNCFRHIAKVDIEHGIITFQLVGIYC